MHLHQTRRRPRFVLDPDAARVFLAEALLRWKQDNLTWPPSRQYGDGWTLAPGWDLDTIDRDELGHVENLVYFAQEAGAIICPAGLSLDLIITAYEYGDRMYDWRVSFGYPSSRFSPCLPYRLEFKKLGRSDPLGDPKAPAARSAWWVLYEAVEQANRILDAYLRAHGRLGPPRRTLREAARRLLAAARAAARKVANRDA
jgi:hypothetical protein